jgi:hypothetical protein
MKSAGNTVNEIQTNSNLEFFTSASKPWLWLSVVAAHTGMAGSIISLSVKIIYSDLVILQ